MPRELSNAEKQAVRENLRRNMDEIMQWSQLYMVFRLLRDEEKIEKDKLAYASDGLSANFNEILANLVPRVEKRKKSFQEMEEKDFRTLHGKDYEQVMSDPLLKLFRAQNFIYHIGRTGIEEKEHLIADLLYIPPSPNRFMLVCSIPELPEDQRDWGIVDSNPVTSQVTETNPDGSAKTTVAHGVYRIWCFRCEEFFTFELNEGQNAEQIVCDRCGYVTIEKRSRLSQ